MHLSFRNETDTILSVSYAPGEVAKCELRSENTDKFSYFRYQQPISQAANRRAPRRC